MIDISDRRELFTDDALIEQYDGASQRLHHPVPREIVIVHDEPWEGNTSYYHTIVRDGLLFRLYYRGSHYDETTRRMTHEVVCYAESRDGLTWEKPEICRYPFHGSTRNNIVWTGAYGSHDFAPFRDWNPEAPDSQRYKAVGRKGKEGLFGFVSPDGIDWSLIAEKPIITSGAFDSQNLAFWDGLRGCYVDFHRGFRDGIRDIMTSTSTDFLEWTEPEWLSYGDAPIEHLYTNQIEPYPRAPHIYVGFPKRYVPGRNPSDHPQDGVSDIEFMSSRDGVNFHRFCEAYIPPGPQPSRWVNRNNFVAWGVVETPSPLRGAPPELSLYSIEDYYRGSGSALRRYTTRLDGFVSLHAPISGGSCITQPLRIGGPLLELNFATSAAGSIDIELLDQDWRRIESISYPRVYGDSVSRIVRPEGGQSDAVAEQPVRLKFTLRDADLYSFRCRPEKSQGS